MVKHLTTMWETWLQPESGRSSGEGNGNPLQYSCLENPMGRGAWWASLWGCKESDMTVTKLSLLIKVSMVILTSCLLKTSILLKLLQPVVSVEHVLQTSVSVWTFSEDFLYPPSLLGINFKIPTTAHSPGIPLLLLLPAFSFPYSKVAF